MSDSRIRPTESLLLVIDYQEKLFAAMPSEAGERHLKNLRALIAGTQALGIPALVTEQYPKGIGPTLKEVSEAFGEVSLPAPIEKTEFSCCENEGFLEALRKQTDKGRRKIIVAGMEMHICVYQSVRDLAARGLGVHVVSDACLSRARSNYERGLALCEREGALITSTETVLFDLLGKAGSAEFKAISKLIQ